MADVIFPAFLLFLFSFNVLHYLQVMGCAMGTICAPAYTNIFMAKFEEKHIYQYIHGRALLFLGYIDDKFMIWNEELTLFIDELNKKHKTIKSDHKISTKRIEFLDTMVYKDQHHKIQTTVFRKPTDQQTYMRNRIITNLLNTIFQTAKRFA